MTHHVNIVGSGPMRGLEVDGVAVLDGKTGRPLRLPKDQLVAATYGQRNEAWHVLLAMGDERRLKCVN
jgi:hypothetical protein